MSTVLKGTHAVKLFAQGSEPWNEWVKANPDASVDFTGIKFFKLPEQYKPISFAEYLFPAGDTLFDHAEFGDGDVDFENANFGDGKVSFQDAIFGTGNISFEFCHFGKGELSFENTRFGDGNVIFHCTEFNDGNVTFARASFGKGDISFFGAQFGKSHVDFSASQFDQGHLGFIYTKFGQGNIQFNQVQLKERHVVFREAQCPTGELQLSKTTFPLPLDLSSLKNTDHVSHLNLRGSQFKAGLDLSTLTFKNPVNLLNTPASTNINFAGFDCDFETQNVSGRGFMSSRKKAKDSTASQCFARLRACAQQNHDVEAEQRFFKKERLSSRWHTLNPLQSLLDIVIEWLCDYGLSMRKPMAIIALMTIVNCATLVMISNESDDCRTPSKILGTGISVTVPFAATSGLLKDRWLTQCAMQQRQKDHALLLFTLSGTVNSFMFLLLFFTLFNRYKLRRSGKQ